MTTAAVRLSLRKNDKLRFKKQFDQVHRDGKKYVGTAMVMIVAPHPEQSLDCGVICSKRYSLLSVERNRARRLFWESFRLLKPNLHSCRLIFIPRQRMKQYLQPQAMNEMAGLMRDAGIFAEVAELP